MFLSARKQRKLLLVIIFIKRLDIWVCLPGKGAKIHFPKPRADLVPF